MKNSGRPQMIAASLMMGASVLGMSMALHGYGYQLGTYYSRSRKGRVKANARRAASVQRRAASVQRRRKMIRLHPHCQG